jgi:hypothetical protein
MSDFAAYVFYVNRPDLLKRAISSFRSLGESLTVVDNSLEKDEPAIFNSPDFASVYAPPVPFTYAQSMNWMLSDAEAKGVNYIIHFHSDAYSDNPGAADDLLKRVRALTLMRKKWACAYTHYDLLWAINPEALREIGEWDTTFPTYFGDNDARMRWKLAGWECVETNIQGVNHEGSATINSDPELQFTNSVVFPAHAELYRQKWGGNPGEETFDVPYGGRFNG